MTWMNEYDIEDALTHLTDETPNLKRGAEVLTNLKDWTNSNSDGWPYWQKPAKAATRLMEIVDPTRWKYNDEDISAADLNAALRPIKAFLTRQGVEHSAIL